METRFARAFTAQNGVKRWTHILDDVNQAINNSIHSSINMRPSDVNRTNAPQLFDYLESLRSKMKRQTGSRLHLGDLVRKVKDPSMQRIFDKGSVSKWSKELYQIVHINKGARVFTFELEGPNGETLDRRFYENELNLVLPLSES